MAVCPVRDEFELGTGEVRGLSVVNDAGKLQFEMGKSFCFFSMWPLLWWCWCHLGHSVFLLLLSLGRATLHWLSMILGLSGQDLLFVVLVVEGHSFSREAVPNLPWDLKISHPDGNGWGLLHSGAVSVGVPLKLCITICLVNQYKREKLNIR